MTSADGSARPEDQIAAAEVAMASVADLVAHGDEVVITHGNGPQVGNLLVKNELAAGVVPPVPLDWCGAQTQATLGLRPDERARGRAGPGRPRSGRLPRSSPGRSSTATTRDSVKPDQADRPLPAVGGGARTDRARPAVRGPRRARLATGGGIAGAARDPRRASGLDAARGRLRRDRGRGWRHPRGPRRPTARCAASRP